MDAAAGFGFLPRHQEVYHEVVETDCYRLATMDLKTDAPIIIDLGAHVGAFALAALRRWPGARYTGADVDGGNCQALTELLDALKPSQPPQLFTETAVVGRHRPSYYVCSHGTCYRTTTLPGESHYLILHRRTLAEIIKGLDQVDLLKLDIEGDEFDVLALAAQDGTLERVRRIVLEWHHPVDPGTAGHDFHPHVSDLVHTLHDYYVEVWPGRNAGGLLWARRWDVPA